MSLSDYTVNVHYITAEEADQLKNHLKDKNNKSRRLSRRRKSSPSTNNNEVKDRPNNKVKSRDNDIEMGLEPLEDEDKVEVPKSKIGLYLSRIFCFPFHLSAYTHSVIILLLLTSFMVIGLMIMTFLINFDQSTKEFIYIFIAIIASSIINLIAVILNKIKPKEPKPEPRYVFIETDKLYRNDLQLKSIE